MRPIEDFADDRARDGEHHGLSCSPWLDPARGFIDEAQEESGDRHNYLDWDLRQALISGESTPEYREAMMIAIQANKTSYMAAEKARSLRAEARAAKKGEQK